jgi:hypothetical protein
MIAKAFQAIAPEINAGVLVGSTFVYLIFWGKNMSYCEMSALNDA